MVMGYHVIFGVYGFWLPNDPRGSWSDFVGAWDLFRYGSATKTSEICSLAGRTHDHNRRLDAKKLLKRPAVRFTDEQIESIARGFSDYASRSNLTILACAILPDHVHLVFHRHRLEAEKLVIQLKGAATRALLDDGNHPFGHLQEKKRTPKCFARGEWKVFLDTEGDMARSIPYVEDNPSKEGLPRQEWDFVVPFSASADQPTSLVLPPVLPPV